MIYEKYYNKTLSNINNKIMTNHPILNNSELPNDFGSTSTILSKKVSFHLISL
jgi:hypothetical protein